MNYNALTTVPRGDNPFPPMRSYARGTNTCHLLSPPPKDEVVRQAPHLFFVEREDVRYAVVAQNSDDAMGMVEWLSRGPVTGYYQANK